MVLIAYALIFALSLRTAKTDFVVNPSLKKTTICLIALVTVQLFYGAFMAGLKAASAAPTWPSINGMILPNTMFGKGLVNGLFFNPVTIHFIHRSLAYIIFIVVMRWWYKTKKESAYRLFYKAKNYPVYFVLLQVFLGISAVLLSPKIVLGSFGIFEWVALLHQLVGMLLLLSLVANVYLIRQKQ